MLIYGIMPTGPATSLMVIRASLAVWWNDWLVLATLNLAWLVCWLTVVLGPPATFVLYRVGHMIVHGQALYSRDLFGFLRHYFFKSWLWMLVNIIMIMGIWVNLQFYANLEAPWAAWLQLFPLLVGALWLALQLYTVPYLLEQDVFSLRQALYNALLTTLASPLYTIILLGFVVLLVYLGTHFIFLFFLGVPCLFAVLGAYAVRERIAAFKVRRRNLED